MALETCLNFARMKTLPLFLFSYVSSYCSLHHVLLIAFDLSPEINILYLYSSVKVNSLQLWAERFLLKHILEWPALRTHCFSTTDDYTIQLNKGKLPKVPFPMLRYNSAVCILK